MRKTGRFLTTAAAIAGGLLLTAAPAEAAPYWQSVSTSSNWSCARTVVHTAKAGVGFQACTVRNHNNDAQVVLVVVNNSTSAVNISGIVDSDFGDGSCGSYSLAVGERRGCFGPTSTVPSCPFGAGVPDDAVTYHNGTVRLTVNGVVNSMESPETQCVYG
ncbi:hypothetical protein AB0A69_11650 [Streptomyces sp. NPDC045431]|uniref:hypothetical protein n=1 Tax=Streptomyces sp. NPDC045431 TaxID=3155613 RepID=UPI0033ED8315